MTGDPHDKDRLVQGVRLRAARERRAASDGEPGVAHRLAQIGVLGWMIVVPMLIGLFGGRWLDRLAGSGVFWTAPLLLLGAVLGCWSAWKWMQRS